MTVLCKGQTKVVKILFAKKFLERKISNFHEKFPIFTQFLSFRENEEKKHFRASPSSGLLKLTEPEFCVRQGVL